MLDIPSREGGTSKPRARLLIAAGNQAELYHLARLLSDSYDVTLLRTPSFGLLAHLTGTASIRAAYRLSGVSRVIEVCWLAWLAERLTFRMRLLRRFHASAINIALRQTSRRYAAIARREKPDHVIGNFMLCRDLIALRPDTILNYPFVAPDMATFDAWDRAYDATEREGFFSGHGHSEWVLDELNHAGTILCGSRYARETLEAFGLPEDCLAVIPFGFDETLFHPVGRQDNAERNKPLKVLFVGPRTYRKGADIIEKLADEIAEFPQIGQLTIVGRGWESRFCRFSGSLVQLRGKVSQQALADLYRSHQFLLMPSRAEGMGLIGLEAKACGCVPIVSDRGPDEYVVDGVDGMIVHDHTAEAWKTVLRRRVDLATFLTLTGPARERAREFTWSQYAREVADVLQKVDGFRS